MLRRLLLCLVLLYGLGACALTVDTIDIAYKPDFAAKSPPGAESITVNLNVEDARTSYRDRVSSKKNGYGMEMAAIVTKRDVQSIVADAFKEELVRHGFNVGESPVVVQVNIQKFYSNFKVGFWSGTSAGEVIFSVQVQDSELKPFFAKHYAGDRDIKGVMLAGGGNAKKAIEPAFANAVKKIMTDEKFIKAIFKADSATSLSGVEKKRPKTMVTPTS
jgi:uncharacterized lipoprotein YajG